MGAFEDLLNEYEGSDKAEPAAKTAKAAKYPTVDELFGKPAPSPVPTPVATKPMQPSPDVQRKIDAGLLPMPNPWDAVKEGLVSDAKAVGNRIIDEAKAIPAGFNDAFSMGIIPSIQEQTDPRMGGVAPGTYQQTMERGPVGAMIGKTAGLVASGGAGLARPLTEGAQTLATGLRAAGAFNSPTVERAVASGLASGMYGAADTAARGGTAEQAFDAGMEGAALGGAVPIAVKGVGVAKNLAGKVADRSVAAAEEHGMGKVIDQATWGKVDKSASQLERAAGVDASLDPETAGKEAILAAAKKHGLGKQLVDQSVPKFAKAIDAKLEAAGKKVGEYVEKAQQLTPGVRLDALEASLESARGQHAVGSQEYKALTAKIAELRADYGETNVVGGIPRIPLWEVQDMASKIANQGYSGTGAAFNDPTASKKLGRQLAKALRDPLYDEINRVALRNPSSVGTPEGFAKARADFHELSALSDIAEAARPKTTTGKTGLFGRMDAWEHIKRAAEGSALAGVSHLAGLPHEITGAVATIPYIKPTADAANVGLAKLINAARAGWPANMYNAAAESLNVSPEIAARVWQQFGPPVIGATSAQGAEPQGGP